MTGEYITKRMGKDLITLEHAPGVPNFLKKEEK